MPAPKAQGPSRAAERPGLGTQFGEADDSWGVETTFVRATTTPAWGSELRYDDRAVGWICSYAGCHQITVRL